MMELTYTKKGLDWKGLENVSLKYSVLYILIIYENINQSM
jgi:hypothetical protein